MTRPIRTTLLLTLALAVAPLGFAQDAGQPAETTTAATASSAAAPAAPERAPAEAAAGASMYEVRNELSALVREHPRELAMVLALDPTLLDNAQFLAGYPALSRFVAEHPEVRSNPRFYLGEFRVPGENGALGRALEPITMFATFVLIAFALSWMIRTYVDQKRWNRLAKTQSEAHNKILDRFGTTEELLAYVKSPAGTKFLESAPIPVRAEMPARSAPLSRVLWSVQVGLVIALGALGMLGVSFRLEAEAGRDLFAMGVIAFCIGVGFVASAVVSLLLARRLGLWPGGTGAERAGYDDSGVVG